MLVGFWVVVDTGALFGDCVSVYDLWGVECELGWGQGTVGRGD